ncbi:MAG TPA: LPS assembly protein LptD [Terriglobales bacterium]|nr:LPS assembly protein LptD [Terriglobales bacterium]
MNSKLIRSGIILGVFLGMTSAPSLAAQFLTGQQGSAGSSLNITADKMSAGNGGNQIEATGNVEIKRDETTLKADEVRLNQATQDVEAKGKVSVSDPEWKVKSADSMQMNLEKETGELQNADLFLEQGHVSMSGRRFQKFGGQSYHVDDGFFTTCLCESGPPSWKFSADQMDLTLDGVGTIRGGYFYVFDVPVLYLPYAYFPLQTERQTGFLFPSVGHSTKDGFRYLQPFFWAISKSTDATVKFNLESRTRVGGIGEFRTIFSQNSDFSITGAYFNESLRQNEQDDVVDRTIADQTIPQNRWSVIGTHRYTIPSDWLTYSDFAAYRDDLFTRELIDRFDLPGSQEANIRRSRYGESRFGMFKNWGDTFVQGEWKFYQDFIQPDSTTLQRTPQLAFWGRRFLSDLPLEFRWRADGVNYLRRDGGDGLRLDLRPEFVMPFRLAPQLFGSFSAAPRETAYHLYTSVKSSDHNTSRELIELRGNVGTAVSRVFAFNSFGLGAVKHVLEPEINYLFVPGVNQSKIPIMDGVDRVNRRNVLQFVLNNRLWGKPRSGFVEPAADTNVELLNPSQIRDVRQLASFRMALSYDIDRERKGGDSLSDLDFSLKFTPYPYFDFGFDGGVNPGPWNLSQARASFALTDPRPILRRSLDADFTRPNSLSFGYIYLRRGPNSFLADDANINLDEPANCVLQPLDPRCPGTGLDKNTVGNVFASLLYHVTDHILFNFGSTYDARDNRFIGFRATTKLLSFCECWTVTVGVSHNVNPDKTSVSFDFNLLGLGTTKSSLK